MNIIDAIRSCSSKTVSRILMSVLSLVIVFCLGCGSARAEMSFRSAVYANPVYGFSIAIPPHVVACVNTPPQPNHGVTLLFSSTASCDNVNAGGVTLIRIEGSFNDDDLTMEKLGRLICYGSILTKRFIKNGRSYGECLTRQDGNEKSLLFFQDKAGSVNYTATLLSTTPINQPERESFIRIVSTLRLTDRLP